MALVITGNPGVGKHTIAEEISKENSYKLLDINKIAIKAGIIENNQDTLDVDDDTDEVPAAGGFVLSADYKVDKDESNELYQQDDLSDYTQIPEPHPY